MLLCLFEGHDGVPNPAGRTSPGDCHSPATFFNTAEPMLSSVAVSVNDHGQGTFDVSDYRQVYIMQHTAGCACSTSSHAQREADRLNHFRSVSLTCRMRCHF